MHENEYGDFIYERNELLPLAGLKGFHWFPFCTPLATSYDQHDGGRRQRSYVQCVGMMRHVDGNSINRRQHLPMVTP
jgi:hypothetical protein